MALSILGRLLAAGLAAAATVAYALPLARFDLNPYDEGVVALGAEQVLKGRLPLVDFYCPYPPAVFYVLALLYRLAGTRLVVERALAIGLFAASVALGSLLVTGLRPPRERRSSAEILTVGVVMAIAGIVMSVIWITPVTGGALTFILLGALLLRTALPFAHPLGALAAGAAFGLAALWRTDFALYGTVAAVAVWVLCAGAGSAPDVGGRRRLVGAIALCVGAGAIALPVFAFLIARGGLRAFNSLFVWPILSTREATLPWPPFVPRLPADALANRPFLKQAALLCQTWPYYFPLAAVALGAWRLLRWRSLAPAEFGVGLWLVLTSGGFYLYASRRTDFIHLLPLLLFALLFAALCLGGGVGERPSTGRLRHAAWLAIGLCVGLPALAALLPGPIDNWNTKQSLARLRTIEIPARRGAGIFPAMRYTRAYGDLIRYLNENVPAGEKLYSGTVRHDLFMVNDVMLLFLAERDPGTYYWCLDAGVTTTRAVQEEMIRELRDQGVNTIVIWKASGPDRPIPLEQSSGSPALDRVLSARFPTRVDVGWYQVGRRLVLEFANPP